MQVTTSGAHIRLSATANRQPRTWPPQHSQSESEARKLAQRPCWQPPPWQRLHLPILCLFALILQVCAPDARAEAPADSISSGTLLFRGRDGQSSEALRVHTDVAIAVSGIIARVDVR